MRMKGTRLARGIGLLAASLTVSSLVFGLSAAQASAAAGQLDPSFARDGVLTSRGLPGAVDVGIQPNGGVVVLLPCGCDQFRLVRFTSTGVRDRSFGKRGVAQSKFPAP